MASEITDPSSKYQDPPNRLADAKELAREVLAEDGPSDVTSDLVGTSGSGNGVVRSREQCIAACLDYASEVASRAGCHVRWSVAEGDRVAPNGTLGTMTGEVTTILRAERPMLNLLQRACGIATATRRFVDAVSGTRCRVLHTRKTAPGLRIFDVAAVVAGGGHVHRLGLDQVVMIKDNHWVALEAQRTDIIAVIEEARRRGVIAVQVEVETETQVETACRAGADRLLIDNRSPQEFRKLADLARRQAPDIELEATGGITLDNVSAYADAGASFVSIGALTHSVLAIDLTVEM